MAEQPGTTLGEQPACLLDIERAVRQAHGRLIEAIETPGDSEQELLTYGANEWVWIILARADLNDALALIQTLREDECSPGSGLLPGAHAPSVPADAPLSLDVGMPGATSASSTPTDRGVIEWLDVAVNDMARVIRWEDFSIGRKIRVLRAHVMDAQKVLNDWRECKEPADA